MVGAAARVAWLVPGNAVQMPLVPPFAVQMLLKAPSAQVWSFTPRPMIATYRPDWTPWHGGFCARSLGRNHVSVQSEVRQVAEDNAEVRGSRLRRLRERR